MDAQQRQQDRQSDHGPVVALLYRTLRKLWYSRLYSDAAKAAFWQTMSLPPLLLGLLGMVGYIGDWFGRGVVTAVEANIIGVCAKVFSPNVVNTIIRPTVEQILTTAQGEIASLAFVISLWAGSSAMSSFVDSITSAHGQYDVRNSVWQRIYALLLYFVGLILAVIGLPLIAVGPGYLPQFFPRSWQAEVADLVNILYYPVLAVLIMLALATLYKVALPRKLPWLRGLPGAALAMLVFLVASVVLRFYIAQITRTGYTYGALAAPIAFLFFTFAIGLAIVIGAHFNAAIQELWPAKMTRRQRRRWRRLEMARTDEKIKAEQQDPEPTPSDTAATPEHHAPDAEPAAKPAEVTTPAVVTEPTGVTKPAETGPRDEVKPGREAASSDETESSGGPVPGDGKAPTTPPVPEPSPVPPVDREPVAHGDTAER